MAFKAGTVLDFDEDSMAWAIENAFKIEMDKNFPQIHLPEEMQVYWRILFVAVAQGVIRHLKEKVEGAFKIDVEARQVIDEENGSDTLKPALESKNPERIHVRPFSTYFGYGIPSEDEAIPSEPGEPAVFVQVSDEDNRIWCEGGTTVGEGGGTVVKVECDPDPYEEKGGP